jgi:AbrB family looped-hinge helix DNA binding protein
MLVTITAKRQVTFPAHVLDALGVKPGDRLELLPSPEGLVLKVKRIDFLKLGTLKSKLPPSGLPFDIRVFRERRQ